MDILDLRVVVWRPPRRGIAPPPGAPTPRPNCPPAPRGPAPALAQDAPALMIACGLALRSFD